LAAEREKKVIEAEKVKDHCKRAEYDAVEYETLELLGRFDTFLRDYRVAVSEELHLEKPLMAAYELKQRSEARRTTGDFRSSDEDIGDLLDCAVVLKDGMARLEAMRPVLNARLETRQRHRKRLGAVILVGGGALFLLIVALLAMVWSR
jgi:hypothetical protein